MLGFETARGASGSVSDVEKQTHSGEKDDGHILHDLKAHRTVVRRNLTKATRALSELYEASPPPGQDDLSLAIFKLEKVITEYNGLIAKLLNFGEEEDGSQIGDAEDMVFKASRLLRRLEKRDETSERSSARQSHRRSCSDRNSGSSEGSSCRDSGQGFGHAFKYKVSSLPQFSGDHTKFPEWWSVFKIVHEERESVLPTIKKFLLLKDCLRGPAAELLAGKRVTEENYHHLISELKEQYGNPLHQISLFSTQLLGMNNAQNNAESLRRLLSEFETSCRELETLFEEMGISDGKAGKRQCADCQGISTEQTKRIMNMFLAPLLLSKLPDELSLLWKRKCEKPKDVFELEGLLSFVRKEVRSRECPEKTHASGACVKGFPETGGSRRRTATTVGLVNQEQQGGGGGCVVCGLLDHTSIYKCNAFISLSVPQRREEARKKGLCYVCLGTKHGARSCRSSGCRVKACGGRHHTWLHEDRCSRRPKDPNEEKESKGMKRDLRKSEPLSDLSTEEALPHYSTVEQASGKIMLMTAIVDAVNPKTGLRQTVKILVDGGSSRTYVRKSLMEDLGLEVEGRSTFTSLLFGERRSAETSYEVVALRLEGVVTQGEVELRALATDRLAHPIRPMKIQFSTGNSFRMAFADDGRNIEQIDVLIGADHYWDVMLPEPPIFGRPNFVPSIFGFMTHGPTLGRSKLERQYLNLEAEENELRSLWELEAMGISPSEESEAEVTVTFNSEKGRYEAKLPWRSSDRPRENLLTATQRLNSVVRKMTEEEKREYNRYVHDLETDGVIEKVVGETKNGVFFLPHFAIRREGKRIRVVFDGSAGINQFLEVGPNLLQGLLKVLVQARFWKCLAQGDVKAAFHQVEIAEEDRDFLSLLWEGHRFRFVRVPFGLCCSPAILNVTMKELRDRFSKDYPDTVNKLESGTYVDDVVAGGNDDEEREDFVSESSYVFGQGGLCLYKWRFSKSIDPGEVHMGSLLGLKWDRGKDVLMVDTTRVLCEESVMEGLTRRKLVSSVSRVFDPLGFCAPWTIRGRILIQEAWKCGGRWDDPVACEVATEWKKWAKETISCPLIGCERFTALQGNSELHVFSDASKDSYAACVYLVTGDVGVLLAARARVTPLHRMTIPRLELLGCFLGVKLLTQIKQNHVGLEELPVTFWTDSTVALYWIQNEKLMLKTFVRNRVKEIRKTPGEWRHVPGTMNPADIASRGLTLSALKEHPLWWNGPSFLVRGRKNWPPIPNLDSESIVDEEEKKTTVLLIEDSIESTADDEADDLFPLEDESRLEQVIRKTALVTRFVKNCKASVLNRHLPPEEQQELKRGRISVEEMEEARNYWLRRSQSVGFRNEMKALEQRKEISRLTKLGYFRPFLDPDTGLLMGLPRNGEPPLPILWINDRFGRLTFEAEHRRMFHGGAAATLTAVRERYHVPKGRVMAKQVVADCRRCRRYRARPSGSPEGLLPENRVKPARPFSICGADFFGPLHLNEEGKVWVLILSCAVIRGVHLEMVTDQSAEQVSLALRRFVARRGVPKVIYSDNAKTFKCLSKIVPWEWKFIPEKAPWHGGFYERLIAVVKNCLKITFHGCALSRVALETAVTEVEAAVNSRPLTYVGTTGDPFPLTPAQFLYGVQPMEDTSVPQGCFAVGKQWRARLRVAQAFWGRFEREYLTLLRTWRRKSAPPFPPVYPGDVVLVKGTEKTPRSNWPLARVVSLVIGRKEPHAAVIWLNGRETRRPLEHLYPIEGSVEEPSISDNVRIRCDDHVEKEGVRYDVKVGQTEVKNEAVSHSSNGGTSGILPVMENSLPPEPNVFITRSGRSVRPYRRTDFEY